VIDRPSIVTVALASLSTSGSSAVPWAIIPSSPDRCFSLSPVCSQIGSLESDSELMYFSLHRL
jgi:hypothetical protein